MGLNHIFIGFGELVIDEIYDYNGVLKHRDGGDTTWNILYNLALFGEECYALAVTGNDINGEIAITSLKNANVNVNYIVKENKKTNIVYELISDSNEITFYEYSPFTKEVSFIPSKNISSIKIPDAIADKDKIIIIMDIEYHNILFLDKITNKKVAIDIGHIEFINNYSKEYILDFLARINICQINYNVVPALLEKLKLNSIKNLYEILNLDLLIVTKGKEEVLFIYKQEYEIITIKKYPSKVEKDFDSSGAGDGFFSVILKAYNIYISQGKKIDSLFINQSFELANSFARKIVKVLGSRGSSSLIADWLAENKASAGQCPYA